MSDHTDLWEEMMVDAEEGEDIGRERVQGIVVRALQRAADHDHLIDGAWTCEETPDHFCTRAYAAEKLLALRGDGIQPLDEV